MNSPKLGALFIKFNGEMGMAKIKGIITISLRIIALIVCVISAILMGTSHQTSHIFNLTFEAKFSYTPSLKYFVIANSIVSFYSLIVLLLPHKTVIGRFVLPLDAIMTLVLTSSFSAAVSIAYVGKNGNNHAGWFPICDQVPKFCDQTKAALVVGLVGLIIYLIIFLYSLYNSIGSIFSTSS